ncbi:hypothetical protein DL93DRAFT_468629 [Clavulina sp. PMI_390]|nr:hypothetical protein DL93DRAFT_468629 [Clavulina sp. PMI_390]
MIACRWLQHRQEAARIAKQAVCVSIYLSRFHDQGNILHVQLQDAEELVKRAKELVRTRGRALATGYLGIADWAQDSYDSYEHLMTAITGVSFVGAGVTYGSIFSAMRGNIGLMAWAFSLFIVALALIIPAQIFLRWCSRLDNYPFSNPRMWDMVVAICIYGASAATFTAISLLVATVQDLHFNVSAIPYNNPNAANWDAPLDFNVDPSTGASFAFSIIGLGIIWVLLIFALFAAANRVNVLLWRRDTMEDLEKQIRGFTGRPADADPGP